MWPPRRGQYWTQGHNLNNFGRGPLDDVLIPNMKATSYDLLMQPTETVEQLW